MWFLGQQQQKLARNTNPWPHPRPTKCESVGVGSASCTLTALQMILILKFENHSLQYQRIGPPPPPQVNPLRDLCPVLCASGCDWGCQTWIPRGFFRKLLPLVQDHSGLWTKASLLCNKESCLTSLQSLPLCALEAHLLVGLHYLEINNLAPRLAQQPQG